MPVVPRADQRPIQQTALPTRRLNINAPIEAFGGGQAVAQIGEASRGMLGATEKFVLEEKRKADDLATTGAWEKMVSEKNRLMFSETGAMNRKGQNAFGVMDEYTPQFKKYNDDLEQSLANEDQKRLFRQMRGKYEVEFGGQLQHHTFSESKIFEEEQTKSAISTLQDDAVKNFHLPGKIEENVNLLRAKLGNYAADNGKPKEWVDENVGKAVSETHSKVIGRMLANGDDITAKNYFKQNKKLISGVDAARLEGALEEGSTRGESQRLADGIETEAGDLTVALAMAKEKSRGNPKLREALEQRLEHRFGVKSQQMHVARERSFLEAANVIENTPSMDPADVSNVPGWQSLLPGQRAALKSLVEQKLNPPEKTDATTWTKYVGMPPEQLAKVTEAQLVMELKPKLTMSDFKSMTLRWASAREAVANPAKSAEIKSMYTDEEMVFESLRKAGIAGIGENDKVGELKDDKAAAYQKFRELVDREWQTAAVGGKMPSGKDKKLIAERLALQKVYVNKNWFSKDPQKPVGIVTDEEKGMAYVPIAEIPAARQDEMKNYVKSIGKRITSDKLQRMRAARLMNNHELYESIARE